RKDAGPPTHLLGRAPLGHMPGLLGRGGPRGWGQGVSGAPCREMSRCAVGTCLQLRSGAADRTTPAPRTPHNGPELPTMKLPRLMPGGVAEGRQAGRRSVGARIGGRFAYAS